MPDGGVEDYSWSVDSKFLAYVSVKKMGKDYAVSTNSDIYLYDNTTGKTINVSEGMMGYDKNPVFSPDGRYLAWTSMARDGYEADKNDIIILDLKSKIKQKLTNNWDETVTQFLWSKDSKFIYASLPYRGTVQLFSISIPENPQQPVQFKKITNTEHDYSNLIGIHNQTLYCHRTDMNHAAELFAIDIITGNATQLTHINTCLLYTSDAADE